MTDVNSNINPFTGAEIKQISSYDWQNMSLEQLYEQMIVMNNRLTIAQNLRNSAITNQLSFGIAELQALIDYNIHKTNMEIEQNDFNRKLNY